MFVVLGIQHAKRMLRIILSSVASPALQYFSALPHKGHDFWENVINLLYPTGHVMHQQFNIQQLYVLPTLYLCVLYLSENKQRLVPLTA